MVSEITREKNDLLIKLTTFLNHHWNPTIYNAIVNNNDIMCIGFISDGREFIQLNWFIEKLSAYLDIDAETAVQTFNETTNHIMRELGFDSERYLYEMVSPELVCSAKDDLLEKIETYNHAHKIPVNVQFTTSLLNIDVFTASSMLRWAET